MNSEPSALKDRLWLLAGIAGDWAPEPEPVLPWMEREFGIPPTVGNVSKFERSLTPWTTEPIERAASGQVRRETCVLPIQSGKSTIGEGLLCYWLRFELGLIQYNWEDDEKAAERWKKRIWPILERCEAVWRIIEAQRRVDRTRVTNGLVVLPNVALMCQGSFTSSNLDSDSVRLQINEEIHNWKPGRLKMAYGRTTKFWDYVIVNLSNASVDGDQLHEAFLAGTQQHWEVKCPGCRQYHRMRTKWEDDQPQLGGLWYDGDKARRDDGSYNYEVLKGTIHYRMPCGCRVHDDATERRPLALSGKFSEGDNAGAPRSERSYTMDAVSTDYSWLELIKEKHEALAALKRGDIEPYKAYVQRRETRFFKLEDRPVVNRIILSDSRKDRDGLKNRVGRFGALDRQKGKISEGEMPHWWGLIQDIALEKVKADEKLSKKLNVSVGAEVEIIHILTVFEGKLLTDSDAADVFKRHNVPPTCVCVDSGWGEDTLHVYQFCLEHGFHAIKGEDNELFTHPDGARRIFSPERPLHLMINQPPTRSSPIEEPQYWFYSRVGILNRLAWLRSSPWVYYEVPSDVSKDFISHMDSWSLDESRKKSGNKAAGFEWVQHKLRDDLLFCAGYIAMEMEMAGFIGANFGTQQTKGNQQ